MEIKKEEAVPATDCSCTCMDGVEITNNKMLNILEYLQCDTFSDVKISKLVLHVGDLSKTIVNGALTKEEVLAKVHEFINGSPDLDPNKVDGFDISMVTPES